MEKPKHAGGRPSKYDPAFCEQIIELGKQGMQTTAIACELGVTKQTLHEWASVYEEFSYALNISRQECEKYLLNLAKLRCNGENEKGSDTMIKFLLSACHGLREKTDSVSSVDMKVSGSIELDFGER